MNTLNTKKASVLSLAIASVLSCAALNDAYALSPIAERDSLESAVEIAPNVELQLNKAMLFAAEKNLAVVIHGSTHFKDRLFNYQIQPSKLLDIKASRQIVIVESSNLDSDLITELLARGNVVVSVGGAAVDTTKRAFFKLLDAEATDGKIESKASFEADQHRVSTVSEGGVEFESIAGYFFSPRGSQSYHATESQPTMALAQALKWAAEVDLTPTVSKTAAMSWTRIQDHVCFRNGTQRVGKILIRTLYERKKDSATTVDTWRMKYQTNYLPGALIRVTDPRFDDWATERGGIYSDVNAHNSNIELKEFAPAQSIEGQQSMTITIGAGFPSLSWSYTIPNVRVDVNSRLDLGVVEWQHHLTTGSRVSTTSYTVAPGAVIRVPENMTPWGKARETYGTLFRNRNSAYDDQTTYCSPAFN